MTHHQKTMAATDIVSAYLETCAWAESGSSECSLGKYSPEFSSAAIAYALERCRSFLHDNPDVEGLDPGQVGHDLWLTSQGHGAGFWDRGLGERGRRLTARAHLEAADVYIGDDGLAHFMGEG